MKWLRLFIVHQFALGYEIRITKKFRPRAPRASRIIAPLFLLTSIILATDPHPYVYQWYDIILISLTVISLLIGFVYFEIWPVKFEELDDYQKFQFLIYNASALTGDQLFEVHNLIANHPEWL